MAIPKTIYQTFNTTRLPWLTKWHIYQMKKLNPEYSYEFFDDSRISSFIYEEYGENVFALYDKLYIGAAKADFFRYAVLYRKGGVYLDIDSLFKVKLDTFILPEDHAIIAFEKSEEFYIQFALFYEAGHPFLKKALDIIMDNILANRYPHDVHKMTGPSAYTLAIHECIGESGETGYRQVGVDYDHSVKFSYPMSKTFLYRISRKNHWRRISKTKGVLKPD